jgi:hypothetical protein
MVGIASKDSRPSGISVLAILYILEGLIIVPLSLFFGPFVFSPGLGAPPHYQTNAFGIISGLIILGLIDIVLGYGFWKGNKWAWWGAVILLGLGLVLELITIFFFGVGSIISLNLFTLIVVFILVVSIAIIYYLTRPKTKKWFGF